MTPEVIKAYNLRCKELRNKFSYKYYISFGPTCALDGEFSANELRAFADVMDGLAAEFPEILHPESELPE